MKAAPRPPVPVEGGGVVVGQAARASGLPHAPSWWALRPGVCRGRGRLYGPPMTFRLPWKRVLLGLGFLLMPLGVATGAGTRAGFTVVHVNNRMGDLDPCGCPKRPLGGLARHVQLVLDRQKAGPTLAVDAGDAFFKDAKATTASRSQAQEKARIIAYAYGRALDAFVPGALDMQEGGDFLVALLKDNKVPALAANLVDASGAPVFPSHVVRQLGSLKVLVVGVVDAATFPSSPSLRASDALAALKATVAAAPAHDVAVLLTSAAPDVAMGWAAAVPQFSLVGTGSTGMLFFVPRTVNAVAEGPVRQAALYGSGKAGKYAALVHVTLVDGHRSLVDPEAYGKARNMKLAAEDRLKARPADASALKQLQDAEAVVARTEADSNVLFELLGFDKQLPEEPEVARRVAAYNAANANREAEAVAHAPAAPSDIPPSSPYVGAVVCGACHQEAFAVWQKMDHSHALASLVRSGQHLDRECIGCHSVGFREPGGFHDPGRVGGFANVQCESCHGPGRTHAQNQGDKTKIRRGDGEATCRKCHTADVTPQFEFARDRLRIRHWKTP